MSKTIYATDDNALEKLKQRLEEQKLRHEEMKKRNKYFRENRTMQGYPEMADEVAAAIDERIEKAYSWCKAPHPQYELTNSNQRIKQTEARIKQLEAENNRNEPEDYKTEDLGFEVYENKEIGRLQIFYPNGGRVDKATYNSLRQRGFVFSRTNEAFQRQLNDNARWSVKRFIEEQRALQAEMQKSEVVAE